MIMSEETEFERNKKALRDYILNNKEKVAKDLEEMREKSNKNNMSAVRYLIEQLFPKALSAEQYYHIEQALQMEKQQHAKTWDAALDKYEVRAGNYMRAYEDFDDYYNENFKL